MKYRNVLKIRNEEQEKKKRKKTFVFRKERYLTRVDEVTVSSPLTRMHFPNEGRNGW